MTHSKRESVLLPEVIAEIRSLHDLEEVSDQQLSDTAAYFSATFVAMVNTPAFMMLLRDPRSLYVIMSNIYARAFLPKMIKDGLINFEKVSATVEEVQTTGEDDESDLKKIWG